MLGKLDHVRDDVIDAHQQDIENALEAIREQGKNLIENIKEMTPDQLSQVIKKNFEGKTYTQIKQSPAYAFITQAAIDMMGEEDRDLDTGLGKARGIDMVYGGGTKKLVRRIQAGLGEKVDGQAGPAFFNAIAEYLDGNKTYNHDAAKKYPVPGQIENGRGNIDKNGTQKIASFWDDYTKRIESKEYISPNNGFREEFAKGKHETPPTETGIGDKITETYNKRDGEGEIVITFWGGTDSTPASTDFKTEDYDTKKNTIIGMLSISNIPNRRYLMDYINNNEFYDKGRSGFTSKYLVGCRNLEAIKVAIEEYGKKFGGQKNVPHLKFAYLGDKDNMMDKAGDKVSQQQRFVEGVAYINMKAGKIEVGGGNVDWIPRAYNDVISDEVRARRDNQAQSEDNLWDRNNDRNGRRENCIPDLKTKTVTIDTWGDVNYCDCDGDAYKVNTCEYNRSTGELRIKAGKYKVKRPYNFDKLILDKDGVPDDKATTNSDIIKKMSLVANLMNRLKRDCFMNKKPIVSTIGNRGIEYQNSGKVRDTVALNKEFLNTLRNKFSLTIETYDIVGVIDRLLVATNVFTDAQMKNELSNKDLSSYNNAVAYT